MRDSRSASEHDCDRILYSDELRRLGGVTQVVAVGETPLFHTRLTHTLKVQQLGRRMAEHLVRSADNAEILHELGGLDPSAAEAAGLAHDLGHPPFGHVGEMALNDSCERAGLDGFEGNAQTFRILTKLSRRGEDTLHGLDISPRTLRAVIKYPWMRAEHEGRAKWNAYPTERQAFATAREGMSEGERSAEAGIMDWADDITYAIHDLEDFVRAGHVPIPTLAADAVEREAFTDRAVERLGDKHPEIDWDQVVANFGDVLTVEFAQFRDHTGGSEDLARLRDSSRRLINTYVSGISLVVGPEPLSVPPLLRGEVELFKQLTWHYVIHDPALATLQEGQSAVVSGLFDALLHWLTAAEAQSTEFRLPRRLRTLYEITQTEPGRDAYHRKEARQARAVADYIASLTERQAVNLHERLRGSGVHSVTDPWLSY